MMEVTNVPSTGSLSSIFVNHTFLVSCFLFYAEADFVSHFRYFTIAVLVNAALRWLCMGIILFLSLPNQYQCASHLGLHVLSSK